MRQLPPSMLSLGGQGRRPSRHPISALKNSPEGALWRISGVDSEKPGGFIKRPSGLALGSGAALKALPAETVLRGRTIVSEVGAGLVSEPCARRRVISEGRTSEILATSILAGTAGILTGPVGTGGGAATRGATALVSGACPVARCTGIAGALDSGQRFGKKAEHLRVSERRLKVLPCCLGGDLVPKLFFPTGA